MIINKIGNILEANENIICHQVNIQGIMGGGLALQIAKSYPDVEKQYQQCCQECNYDETMLGNYQTVSIGHRKYIVNCFTQKINYDTDYEAIEKVFNELLESCKRYNLTIAIPYRYGCGIANGDWNIVSKIFENLSDKHDVDISIYRLEVENER